MKRREFLKRLGIGTGIAVTGVGLVESLENGKVAPLPEIRPGDGWIAQIERNGNFYEDFLMKYPLSPSEVFPIAGVDSYSNEEVTKVNYLSAVRGENLDVQFIGTDLPKRKALHKNWYETMLGKSNYGKNS